uniref:EF-hand calcium-binding domain containing protein 1-like protein n=1 Tax=Patelloida mimula TaxID=351188 RepID=A0A8U0ARY0_9GAST|nr:eF-hand calcium-binding domain containing protein 1-like protein [Patelloida mimula]
MKFSVVLVAVLVICLASNADAGWFRKTIRKIGRFISRNVRRIKEIGCPLLCPKVCNGNFCKLVCRLGCGHRGKREAVKATEGHIAPLPNMFDSYDFNDDGFITKDELATSINENKTDSHFLLAFTYADVDGNGILNKEEFYKGPFVLEMDVNDDDVTYCRYRLDIDDDLEDLMNENEDTSDGANLDKGTTLSPIEDMTQSPVVDPINEEKQKNE